MTSKVPQGVKGFTGKWSGSEMEQTWNIPGAHRCTAGKVPELGEAVVANIVNVRNAIEPIRGKRLVLHYVNITLIIKKKKSDSAKTKAQMHHLLVYSLKTL